MNSVSIIVPIYNVAPYIKECLKSIVEQSYQGHIECVLVDDCSSDNSISIVEDFLGSYTGKICFRIIHREKNGGLSAARNTGTQAATGDYIYYLDSDDYITPDCIEVMAHTAKKYPNADFIQAGIIDTNGNKIYDVENIDDADYQDNKTDIYAKLVFGKYPVSSWNKLIKKDFIKRNNISFYEGVIHEDVDFIYKVARNINAIAICNKNTYVYRTQREGSILSTANNEKSTNSRILIYNTILDNIDEQFRQITTRSIFVRLQYVLLNKEMSEETEKELKKLCLKLISVSVKSDKQIMKFYFALPLFVQRNLYGLIYKKMTKI